MPSIRTIFTSAAITTLSLLQFSSASPVPSTTACKSPSKPPFPVRTVPNLPVNGGIAELPSPTLTLVAVAIGRGIQNYTCTDAGVAPVAIGAIATLFDATPLAQYNESILHQVPALAVYYDLPTSAITLPQPIGTLKVLGKHYFDAAGTPTFDLSTTSEKTILFAAKSADIKAPATADNGPAGTGAIDWLFLKDKGGVYTSLGLSQVYRVETAGGVGPTCTGTGLVSIQYAAEYWFYK